MTTSLNPSIVGQAEKLHNAVLFRLLDGTSLDETQWITLQLTGTDALDRHALIDRVSTRARFTPGAVSTAIDALVGAGLLAHVESGDLVATASGAGLVADIRRRSTEYLAPAYGEVPAADLEVTARSLQTITAALGRALDRPDGG